MIKYKHEHSTDVFILHDCSYPFFYLLVKDPSNLFENILYIKSTNFSYYLQTTYYTNHINDTEEITIISIHTLIFSLFLLVLYNMMKLHK